MNDEEVLKEIEKKKNPPKEVVKIKEKGDWNYIFYSQKLSEEFIRKFKNKGFIK